MNTTHPYETWSVGITHDSFFPFDIRDLPAQTPSDSGQEIICQPKQIIEQDIFSLQTIDGCHSADFLSDSQRADGIANILVTIATRLKGETNAAKIH
jgi:hypothetical protein